MKTLKLHWSWICWLLMIIILMGVPGNYFPQIQTLADIIAPDKLVHFFLFGVLSFLLLRSFTIQYSDSKYSYIISAVMFFSGLCGALTELAQHYIFIGRNGNVYDFIADVIGCLIGLGAFVLVNRKKTLKT